ncbi:MAG TPA: HAD-IIIC family phosphatase [Candidatus Paceibacterota bacterium]|nr:HAD-IIIC family phosphatase [Candidatus Paceibacterota bacterium]
MKPLEYIRASREGAVNLQEVVSGPKINIVTNFTDDILKDMFLGVNFLNGVRPFIYKTPYRQYLFALKDKGSPLYTHKADITFIFFDINPFKDSEFKHVAGHFDEILGDIERYCAAATGTVVFNSFVVSYRGAYGNLFNNDPFFKMIVEYNRRLEDLAARISNLVIFDTNRLAHILGESRVFDLRGLYAFDIPYTHEFMAFLAEEWFAFVRIISGRTKKAIVLDLDNTLWGGIVGELGALGISLGPDYPGNAFVNFQRALREFYDRGVILAIASKNNERDVEEVFEKNPNMVLKKDHFAAIRTNWEDKAQNILEIADELNIGTESMIFLDDDPLTRALVRAKLPGVTVPDFSLPPEEYAAFLYQLDLFNQFSLTDEDAQKGKMYAEERQRKEVMKAVGNVQDYISQLGIVAKVDLNGEGFLPRIAQLTQKTNQFNLTTRRYSEADVKKMIADGAFVFSANVSDKFGDYGTVILAIVIPGSGSEATLDTFLMSCRVMGRGIECSFMDHIIRSIAARGIKKLNASFVPTAKNKPADGFLAEHGFAERASGREGGMREYSLDIPAYLQKPCKNLTKAVIISNN